MPGIYTHNIIFRKTLKLAGNNVKKGMLYKSIESFFGSEQYLRAGLFGSLGPDIFDYLNPIWGRRSFGSEVSFYLHDEAHASVPQRMVEILYEGNDPRGVWSSLQKAYLMGYVSHLIGSALINPYVFFKSGIPGKGRGLTGAINREKFLLFHYNIDNYFIYKDEETSKWKLKVEDMFCLTRGKKPVLPDAIKAIILKSLKLDNEELFNSKFKKFSEREIDGTLGGVATLERVHERIKFVDNLKRSGDTISFKTLSKLEALGLMRTDFSIPYPPKKRADIDALNIHMGPWQFPCVDRKIRYESVPRLVSFAAEKTLEAWLEIESMVYGNENVNIESFLQLNPYTGLEGHRFSEMDHAEPVKLRF